VEVNLEATILGSLGKSLIPAIILGQYNLKFFQRVLLVLAGHVPQDTSGAFVVIQNRDYVRLIFWAEAIDFVQDEGSRQYSRKAEDDCGCRC